jgi:hypothetical protein
MNRMQIVSARQGFRTEKITQDQRFAADRVAQV